MKNYRTVIGLHECEIEEKKSIFIGLVKQVRSEEEANEFINETRKKHPDSRHCVYAYVLGENGQMARYSDDKEPKGTAGLPVLDIINKNELKNTCVIVVRYFGGTLLGASLLTRTYAKAASCAVNGARKVEVVIGYSFKAKVSYEIYSRLTHYIEEEKIQVVNTEFTDEVIISIVTIKDASSMMEDLKNRANGKIEFTKEESDYYYIDEEGILSNIY